MYQYHRPGRGELHQSQEEAEAWRRTSGHAGVNVKQRERYSQCTKKHLHVSQVRIFESYTVPPSKTHSTSTPVPVKSMWGSYLFAGRTRRFEAAAGGSKARAPLSSAVSSRRFLADDEEVKTLSGDQTLQNSFRAAVTPAAGAVGAPPVIIWGKKKSSVLHTSGSRCLKAGECCEKSLRQQKWLPKHDPESLHTNYPHSFSPSQSFIFAPPWSCTAHAQ